MSKNHSDETENLEPDIQFFSSGPRKVNNKRNIEEANQQQDLVTDYLLDIGRFKYSDEKVIHAYNKADELQKMES